MRYTTSIILYIILAGFFSEVNSQNAFSKLFSYLCCYCVSSDSSRSLRHSESYSATSHSTSRCASKPKHFDFSPSIEIYRFTPDDSSSLDDHISSPSTLEMYDADDPEHFFEVNKELNKYREEEMEVHPESKKNTSRLPECPKDIKESDEESDETQ